MPRDGTRSRPRSLKLSILTFGAGSVTGRFWVPEDYLLICFERDTDSMSGVGVENEGDRIPSRVRNVRTQS